MSTNGSKPANFDEPVPATYNARPEMPRTRAWIICLVAALLAALAFLSASLLGATGSRLPLDDAFIFFQYARQVATGHGLSYNGSDPASGGATSLATVALDAVGYLVGFRGDGMVLFALLCGGAGLFLALWACWRLALALEVGIRSGPRFLLLNGPLLWGLFAGMDLPLYVAALLWSLASWAKEEAPGSGRRETILWGPGRGRPAGRARFCPASHPPAGRRGPNNGPRTETGRRRGSRWRSRCSCGLVPPLLLPDPHRPPDSDLAGGKGGSSGCQAWIPEAGSPGPWSISSSSAARVLLGLGGASRPARLQANRLRESFSTWRR